MIPADWLDKLASPFIRGEAGVAVTGALGDETGYVFHGRTQALEPAPNASTLFELGGLTEIFTALLAAVAARDDVLPLDRPIAGIGPELAGLPEWITPLRLATHTAGLPRLPGSVARSSLVNTANPYAGFAVDDLLAWASGHRPKREPSATGYAHSILGMALLGVALAIAYDTPLDRALRARVLDPLGMADTIFTPDDAQSGRIATPHDRKGGPVSRWTYAGLMGAGGLLSSPADMGRFLVALLAAKDDNGPLAAAIRDSLEIRRQAPRRDGEGGGLGWAIVHTGKPPAFVHTFDARTNGSRAMIAVAPGPGLGAVVLANSGPRPRDTMRPPRREFLRAFTLAWAAKG